MKNPFHLSNYPPGAENDPNAPWNQVDFVGECFECGKLQWPEDMSQEERWSLEDNDDGGFLCDSCHVKRIDGTL